MSIGLNTTQTQVHLRELQDNFKMNELGDERTISIGRENQIVKAEIMDAPNRPQHKPHEANKGLEGLFKATIDKCNWWHSAGKLRRAQDAIEVNLGRVAGKFVNLQTLAGRAGVDAPENIRQEKTLLISGIAKELSAFETEINSLADSYHLNREEVEPLFLQRLINSLEKNNPKALNRLKAAVDVMSTMPLADNQNHPVMGNKHHCALVRQLDKLLDLKMPGGVGKLVDQRTVPQKIGDVFKGLFGTKEQRVRQLLHEKLKGLEELCETGGLEMKEFTDQLRSLRDNLTSNTELTMDDFEGVGKKLDSIIGETIKRGQEIAQKALETESAKMAGQLNVDKYQPQLVSAKEANRDLSKLFGHKNTTLAQAKRLQSPINEKVDDLLRNTIRSQSQSLEMPKGARAVVQVAVNSVNKMTRDFVAARQELKSLGTELSAITLAKQLNAKGETPPVGVDVSEWREACSVMVWHLLDAPGSPISEKDIPALNLIKENEAQFTEGLQDVAVPRFKKLFTRLDASVAFTVSVPKPSPEQIEKLKQTGKILLKDNAVNFGTHMQEWHNLSPKTGIPELKSRLEKLRAPITLNPDKLDEASLRNTLTELKGRITDIKSAYSYEMASDLSGLSDKQARLDRRMELKAGLNSELQKLVTLEADLTGMINMHVMGRLPSEGLDLLRQSCPKSVDRGTWESDCNTIIDSIMEHPQDIPGQETVAVLERLLDTFNTSLTGNDEDKQKVELYQNLKKDLEDWKDWSCTVGMEGDSLNGRVHMSDVLQSVSKMTTARIRIADTVNLMQDSFIALTKAGFSHADELRSNLSEYTHKLMAYADAISSTGEKRPLECQEAQESLSKTIHSFFPAMEFLAGLEHTPNGLTQDQTQQVTDLRTTLFNAYTALFDISDNIGVLSLEASQDVSPLLSSTKQLSPSAVEARKDANLGKFNEISHMVDPGNPNSMIEDTNPMLQEFKADLQSQMQLDREPPTTKFFKQTQHLTTALVEAKAKGLDPAVARSIERLFSEHVLSPAGILQLDHFIPDKKMHDNFTSEFEELNQALIQTCLTLQNFNLNVKSTQTRINIEAQNYLKECVKVPKDPFGNKTTSLRNSLKVLSSHDIDGKMSRILMESDLTKEPRLYNVSLNQEMLTFTPNDDNSGKGVFFAPVSNGATRFPKL